MSRRRYRIERAAARDLEETVDYLREDSPGAARRFVEACHETFRRIQENPGIGRLYEPLDERLVGIRVFRVSGFEAWLVFYRLLEVVQVERVLHGARDLPRVLP